jgi:hypothetical protein
MKVGRYLVGEGKKIRLGVTAQSLDVDVRTLWNWKKEAKEGLLPKKIGRPVYTFLGVESPPHFRERFRIG